jgi:hypothetical protein
VTRKVTKRKKLMLEKWGHCCDYLTRRFKRLWNLFVEGIWKSLEKQARKRLECYKIEPNE